MLGKDWRDKLDPGIESKLEKLLREVKAHEEAYSSTFNKKDAQMWVAIAKAYDKLDRVNRRLKRIEKLLDKIESNSKKNKMKDKELRKSLNKF